MKGSQARSWGRAPPGIGAVFRPAERDPPLHGGGADPGEGERFVGERIRRGQIIVALQPPAPEQPPDTGADGGDDLGDLVVAGGRGWMEAHAARRLFAEQSPRVAFPNSRLTPPLLTMYQETRIEAIRRSRPGSARARSGGGSRGRRWGRRKGGAMPARTGHEYLRGLQTQEREIWLRGERTPERDQSKVRDVCEAGWWGQSPRTIRMRRSRSRRSVGGSTPISRLNDSFATAISCPMSTSLSRSIPATLRLSLSRRSPAFSTT